MVARLQADRHGRARPVRRRHVLLSRRARVLGRPRHDKNDHRVARTRTVQEAHCGSGRSRSHGGHAEVEVRLKADTTENQGGHYRKLQRTLPEFCIRSGRVHDLAADHRQHAIRCVPTSLDRHGHVVLRQHGEVGELARLRASRASSRRAKTTRCRACRSAARSARSGVSSGPRIAAPPTVLPSRNHCSAVNGLYEATRCASVPPPIGDADLRRRSRPAARAARGRPRRPAARSRRRRSTSRPARSSRRRAPSSARRLASDASLRCAIDQRRFAIGTSLFTRSKMSSS